MRIARFIGIILLIFNMVNVSFSQDDVNENYISKGQWLVGGGFSLGVTEDLDSYSFSVSPMGGYFLGEKIVVGLSTGYSHSESFSSYSGFSAQPFFRYYITQNRLTPFAEVAYGAAWSKINYIDYTNVPVVEKNTSALYRIGVGLDYFVTKNVALEGNLRYTSNNSSGTINFSVGLQFFIR